MPRVARVVVPGMPHHLTQRGNNRQDVFFVDEDRRVYLKILGEQCRRYGVGILGYCLMTNHVHLIAVPAQSESLAKAIGRTHWLYAQYVNRLHARSGHLWQNRFYSNPLDDEHCLLAMRYVERNPIRAGLCRVARRYPWSSAAAHCRSAVTKQENGAPRVAAIRGGADVLDMRGWHALAGELEWESELSIALSPAEVAKLRRVTQTGRPLASDSVVSKLERALGRRLRPLPVGRPTKKRKNR